jgi:hypothetical protein
MPYDRKREIEDINQFKRRLSLHFHEIIDLLAAKRQSYGSQNLTMFGGLGIVVRANDKLQRLGQMYQQGEIRNADGDSMEDAWRDLIGYGVLGLIHHLDETGQTPDYPLPPLPRKGDEDGQ